MNSGFSHSQLPIDGPEQKEWSRYKVFKHNPELKVLDSSLDVQDIYTVRVGNHIQDLRLFPKNILESLKKAGVKFYLINRPVTQLNWNKKLKPTHPRGWYGGAHWNTVGGAYNPYSKSVSAGNGAHGSASIVLHETGHAIAKLLTVHEYGKNVFIINSKGLKDAHNRLYSKLSPYEKQSGENGLSEFFAESLAVLLKSGDKAAIKRYDYRYVQHFLKAKVLKLV